jgi:phosphohistidine phosphatase
MKLYFLRHASAQDVAPTDDARELTNQGQEEARVAGEALVILGIKPGRILSSPLVRARQTAAIVAVAMQFAGKIEPIDELRNGQATASLLKAIKSQTSNDEVLLVGHMPSLAEHVAALVGAKSSESFPIGKGGVACVELEQLRAGTGQLRWLMRHNQLRTML